MISYHPKFNGEPWQYKEGFRPLGEANLTLISAVMRSRVWSPIIWENGTRLKAQFKHATYIGLDFDSGEMTLDQAVENYFCDMVHIIGTTRSHQKEKSGKSPCDRFRVLLRLDETLTDVEQYCNTVARLIMEYGSDTSGKDGARFFYPCKTIVSINTDGYTVEPSIKTTAKPVSETVQTDINKRKAYMELKNGWVKTFIEKGKVPSFANGRNQSCYWAAKTLFYLRYDKERIIEILSNAPIDPTDFGSKEIMKAVNSAEKRANKDLEQLDKESERYGK